MIIDDVIWEVINNTHCSYKSKTVTNTFCRNTYNLTGLCNRNSCPLANSRYATVNEEKGVCYLYLKTAERAHTPKELWEKIKLDKCYRIAMEQLEENLQYWPEFLKHKCKQRLTKLRQMLVKKRRMKLQGVEQYEVVSRKAEKREKSRLVKAEKSALIDKHIEQELLKNVQSGKYPQFLNVDQKNFQRVLDKQEIEIENEEEFNSEEIDNVFVGDIYGEDIPEDDEESFDYRDEDKYSGDNADDHEENDKKKDGKLSKSFDEDKTNFTTKKRNRKTINKNNKKGLNIEYEYNRAEKQTEQDMDW